MDYIYAELNRDVLPKELAVYWGFSKTKLIDKVPTSIKECENPETLRILGTYTQEYKLNLSSEPMYPYFIYPVKYGTLKQIKNGIMDIIQNWSNSIVVINNTNYYMYYYNNRQAPGFTQNYTFKIAE